MDDWAMRDKRESYVSMIRGQFEKHIPQRYHSARLSPDRKIDISCSWYIFGHPGRGKTYTAYAAQRKRIVDHSWLPFKRSEDHDPQLLLVENVAEILFRAKSMELSERQFEIRRLCSGQDLILDDIGSENISPFTEDFLIQIINHRHDHLRYTGFTSNFNIGDLPYDPRIKSRIAGMVGDNWCEMKGEDMRLKSASYMQSKEARDSTKLSEFESIRQRINDHHDTARAISRE